MSVNILVEPNIVGDYYGEYLNLIKTYANNKRSSIFVKYFKINKEQSSYDTTKATFDRFNESKIYYDIYDYTPLYNFGAIVNETAEQSDLAGQMIHSFSSAVVYTIEEPNVDDLIVIEYNPNTKTKNEIFIVTNVRLSMAAKNTDIDANWYELTLENAPINDIHNIKINERFVYLSTKEQNIPHADYIVIVNEVNKLDSLLEDLKSSFDKSKELYHYDYGSSIDEIIFNNSGLNDITINGIYNGTTNETYIVEIDSIGETDTFKWSDDNGSTWTNAVDLTTTIYDLSSGIRVKFNSITGHAVSSRWTFNVYYSYTGNVTFGGQLDDAVFTGTYTSDISKDYIVEIDNNATLYVQDNVGWSGPYSHWIWNGSSHRFRGGYRYQSDIQFKAGVTYNLSFTANSPSGQGYYLGWSEDQGSNWNWTLFVTAYPWTQFEYKEIEFTPTVNTDTGWIGVQKGGSLLMTFYSFKLSVLGLDNDTFQWSDDDGSTWTENIEIDPSQQQLLNNGINVQFSATEGHLIGDRWEFSTIPRTSIISLSLNYELYNLLAVRKHFNRSFLNKYLPYGYKCYINEYLDYDITIPSDELVEKHDTTATTSTILDYTDPINIIDMVKLLTDFTGF